MIPDVRSPQTAEPKFKVQGTHKRHDGDLLAVTSLFQGFEQAFGVNNPDGSGDHIPTHLEQAGPVRGNGHDWRA